MLGNFLECLENFTTRFLFSKPALNMIWFIENHVGQFPKLPCQLSNAFFAACAIQDSVSRKSCWAIFRTALTTFKLLLFFAACAQHDSVDGKTCWTISRTACPIFAEIPSFPAPAPNMILHIENHVGQFPRCPPNFQTQFLFSYPALNMILVIKNHAGQFPACRDDFHKGAFVSTCAQHDSVY